MQPTELLRLESQVDYLMRTVESLRFENNQLRQKIATHIQENTRLKHKNDRAIQQVKHIIKNMKEELP
ncbi:MAG: hypothetical protein A3E84_02070 [Gammaproteobacteria bacterium RIFCSPHIGHO2_12_FULL_42_13]|nr:MAG: hypothetical protein A3E84_02070 [Gammaproteobacteria bacterium RIFCSPHIGHO2_12_FULL_42_13]